jgi:hypothetical protein
VHDCLHAHIFQTAVEIAKPMDWLFATPSDGILEAQQVEQVRFEMM